ncbi:MAG: polysaccharide biosynthesis protein [Flavobacteriales bacterium]|uniref:polysaccharide biosynthesis protein n=1 Tax=Candidatus Ulvibacter alkanivorans TaxID=2267620 RepID=UPI001FE4C98C|nr:nucleoside-diphosphate sugar epimerase/dehydratase [Candidatus Ulvibacter alkanivorans]MCH2490718.1 polysaccharide biosynthesis protein [Flavobacteriales bacterium]
MNTPKTLFKSLYQGDDKIKMLDQRYLPRWIVVLIDAFLAIISLGLVYFILLGSPLNFFEVLSLPMQGAIILGVNVVFFFVYKTYSGIIRHSTFTDVLKLAFSSFTTAASIAIFNYTYVAVFGEKIFLTTSLLLYLLISFVIMLFFRIAVKESYQFLRNTASNSKKKRVAIIGVDDHTISLGKALTTESNMPFQLIGFLTRNIESTRYKILGKPVFPIKDKLSEELITLNIEGVLIMSESFTGKEKNEIVEHCLASNVEVFNVPTVESWNKKEDIDKQIKPIQIEDLLEREPIHIDNELIKQDLSGKTILVTGGAGSIGSEIVRQLAQFSPKLLVILDQAETALHELDLYLQLNYPELNFITELADISNMHRVGLLFSKYEFNIIYHAAAYKHVPIIERNPHEAIYVNILGTVNLSILAASYDIEKFVMVSTDKAVNPTNVMGASKRAAEMYVQSLQNEKGVHTRFITTRFGNVLGSSGSVIPHFRKQISQGGPVTVTHENIIRYFMTIPEACQLVLQAGTMGAGGEIYVFDMGKPVKILNLAERMIRLSGLEPYVDIDIKITGLRPGEKLYEELLNDTSTVQPTHHPKIMISKVPTVEFIDVKKKVKEIVKSATRDKDKKVVKLLKELVPEFKSENSEFQELDHPKREESTEIKIST